MTELNEVNLINDFLCKQVKMNFKLYHIGGSAIEILGFLEEDGSNKIKIIFNQPYMMLCTFSFIYKGKGDFLSLVENDKAIELNKQYGIIKGNKIYRISNTDMNDDMYIAAQRLEVRIME